MHKSIQLIQITPKELQDLILVGIKSQIDELKNDFQPISPTEFLTRNEVAGILKINLSTLSSWTKKGKLTSYGIEGRVYYKRNEIENALTQLN